MGMAAAEAGDPGGGEHLVPALPPHLVDLEGASPIPHSPASGRKAPSTAALVPVDGAGEELIPAMPPSSGL